MGRYPLGYPLRILQGAGYRKRTEQNVIDSDGTVIVYFDELSGGTKLTVEYCEKRQKPYLLIDAQVIDCDEAAVRLDGFVDDHGVNVLNVAGPRASGDHRGYPYTKELITSFLNRKSLSVGGF